MNDAFWHPRAPGSVEYKERIFCVHRFGSAFGARSFDEFIVQNLAPNGFRNHRVTRVPHYDRRFDAWACANSFICDAFKVDYLSPAERAVRGNQDLGVRVVNSVSQRSHAKASIHDAVHSSDLRAREHRYGSLDALREVHRHTVPFSHAELLKRVCHPVYLARELGIGDLAFLSALVNVEERDAVATFGGEVTIHCVMRDICPAANEPLVKRRLA